MPTLQMGRLNMLDSLALIILEKAAFWQTSGWLIEWATRRIRPHFDQMADAAITRTIQDTIDPVFEGRVVTFTYWAEIKDNMLKVEGVAETGLSFEGTLKAVFRRFVAVREACILPSGEGSVD